MNNPQLLSDFNRKRNIHLNKSSLIHNDEDIISIFLKRPVDLSLDEKKKLKQYYSITDRNAIIDALKYHKIYPFAAHIFSYLNCDKVFWDKEHQKFVDRNKKIKSLLHSIFTKMKLFSCKSLTLTENFGVILSTNSCIGCFCSGDVDLSADLYEKDIIESCLNEFNFYSKKQPEKIGQYSGQSMQFYNDRFIDGGFWINVIWKPVTRAYLIQDKYELRLSADRLKYKLIPNTNIKVLGDTSLMYFSALHISAGHYFTLSPGPRLYVDIDRLSRCLEINWKDLIKWEDEDDAGIRISMVLYICSKFLNSPIPEICFKKVLKNKRNNYLFNYLYNKKKNNFQDKGSLIRRLYIELASDDRNILFSFLSRLLKAIF